MATKIPMPAHYISTVIFLTPHIHTPTKIIEMVKDKNPANNSGKTTLYSAVYIETSKNNFVPIQKIFPAF